MKWEVLPGVALTAAAFDLDRSSFTSTDPEDVGQVIVIEGSKTQGVEVQLTGDLTDKWSVNTGYTYLDGQVRL